MLILGVTDALGAITVLLQGTCNDFEPLKVADSILGLLPLLHARLCTAVTVLALTFQLIPFLWYTCVCYSVFRVWYQLQLKEDENAVRTLLLRHLFVYVALCCLLPLLVVVILYHTAALGVDSTGDSNRYHLPMFSLRY